MNGFKRKKIRESTLVLMGALERMRRVYEEEEDEEVLEKLEEAISGLEEAIETLTDAGYGEMPMEIPAAATETPVAPVAPAAPAAPVAPAPAKEEGIGCLGWLFAIALPLILAVPLTAMLISAYQNDGEFIYLLMIFPILLVYIIFVRGLAKKFAEPLTPSSRKRSTYSAPIYRGDDEEGRDHAADRATYFGAGLLGGYLLGKHVGKNHKSFSEKWHDDIFWQEKYRRHDHYDDGNVW